MLLCPLILTQIYVPPFSVTERPRVIIIVIYPFWYRLNNGCLISLFIAGNSAESVYCWDYLSNIRAKAELKAKERLIPTPSRPSSGSSPGKHVTKEKGNSVLIPHY